MDREAETGEAVSCAVSLDGVPFRSEGDEEACRASSKTVSFHHAEDTRLKTLSFGPETGKTTLKVPLTAKIAHVWKVRPDLKLVAIAAPDNWTFLEKLRPDEQAVDFFHACERPGEVADHRDRLVRQVSRHPARRRRAGSAIRYLRDRAATKTATAVLERELGFFRRHRHRTRYASLKAKAPASSANKVLVNQCMKRAHWSVDGGQHVLTFRAMSGRFDAARRAMTGTGGANDSLNAVAA